VRVLQNTERSFPVIFAITVVEMYVMKQNILKPEATRTYKKKVVIVAS
jgi:hypothetical protein